MSIPTWVIKYFYVLEDHILSSIIKFLSHPTHTSGQVNMCYHGSPLEAPLTFWGTYVSVKDSLLEEIESQLLLV